VKAGRRFSAGAGGGRVQKFQITLQQSWGANGFRHGSFYSNQYLALTAL